jgi:hypothetical protein
MEIPRSQGPTVEATQLATLHWPGVHFLSFVYVIPPAHLLSCFTFTGFVHKVPRLCLLKDHLFPEFPNIYLSRDIKSDWRICCTSLLHLNLVLRHNNYINGIIVYFILLFSFFHPFWPHGFRVKITAFHEHNEWPVSHSSEFSDCRYKKVAIARLV